MNRDVAEEAEATERRGPAGAEGQKRGPGRSRDRGAEASLKSRWAGLSF